MTTEHQTQRGTETMTTSTITTTTTTTTNVEQPIDPRTLPYPRNPHGLKPEEVAILIALAEVLGTSRRCVRIALDTAPGEPRPRFIDVDGKFTSRLWAIEDVRARLTPVLAHRAIVAERQRELELRQQLEKPAHDEARKARRAAKVAGKVKPKPAAPPKPSPRPPSGPRTLPPLLARDRRGPAPVVVEIYRRASR